MKKFRKKTVAVVLVVTMLLAFVPSLSFADEPADPMMILRMDSDYHKKGDEFTMEVWVYNSTFNVAGFCLEYDEKAIAPAGESFYDTVTFDEYHGGDGIFDTVTASVDSGIIKAVMYVNPNTAAESPVYKGDENPESREVRVSGEGYKFAEIKFTALKDGKVSAGFTKSEGDSDFAKRSVVLAIKGSTPSDAKGESSYEKTPAADAEKFGEEVEKIGNVTAESEGAITEALAKYEALDSIAKELAEDAKKALDEKKAQLDGIVTPSEDDKAAEKVREAIKALPATDKITLDDEGKVAEAKAMYDALSENGKALVGEELTKALEDAAAKINELKTEGFKTGDVDGDGGITAKDATQILRYINGKSSAFTADGADTALLIKIADVDKDGSVTAKDATQILRHINGKTSVIAND